MDVGSGKSGSEERAAPQKVFYVVETVGEVIGERNIACARRYMSRVRTQRPSSSAYARLPAPRARTTASGVLSRTLNLRTGNQDVVNANGSVSRHTQPVALAGAASECLLQR